MGKNETQTGSDLKLHVEKAYLNFDGNMGCRLLDIFLVTIRHRKSDIEAVFRHQGSDNCRHFLVSGYL